MTFSIVVFIAILAATALLGFILGAAVTSAFFVWTADDIDDQGRYPGS